MSEPRMMIDARLSIYYCDCDDCPGSGKSMTEEEMTKLMFHDLIDWLGERGLIFSGSYKLVDMNEEDY